MTTLFTLCELVLYTILSILTFLKVRTYAVQRNLKIAYWLVYHTFSLYLAYTTLASLIGLIYANTYVTGL